MRASVIALTGTPGTGKTTVAKIVAKRTGWTHLDLNKEIVRRKLYSGYDHKRKSYIADMKKVTAFVKEFVAKENGVIVDGHLSHNLPANVVDEVIILRCSPAVLKKRLEGKKWPKEKVAENVEAERIGIVAWEARKNHRNITEIDTTRAGQEAVATKIEKALKGRPPKGKDIEWLK
ncbi:MAG: adenylate kinase family protein [Candidatus Aenigmatarchaeota archaeon]